MAKLELDEIKNAIRVDYDDDDVLIALLNDGAIDYLKGATGFDLEKSDSSKANIFCLAMVNEMYKDRGMTTNEAGQKIRPIMNDILIQLSYEAKRSEM